MSIATDTAYQNLAGTDGPIAEAIVIAANQLAGTPLSTPVNEAELALLNAIMETSLKNLMEARRAYAVTLDRNIFDEISD